MKFKKSGEFKTKISGVQHSCPHTGMSRQEIIKKHIRPGTRLIPIAEPENNYDPNAVGLWLMQATGSGAGKFHVGYLNPERAKEVSRWIKENRSIFITVLEITGGTSGKRSHGVNIAVKFEG